MKFVVYKNTCAVNGLHIMDAFIDYINIDNDVTIINDNRIIKSDIAVMWSVLLKTTHRENIWNCCQENKIPMIILEVGGLIRSKTWKIAINGINADAKFGHKNSSPGRLELFKHHFKLEPWKKNENGPILICGQDQKCHTLDKINVINWITETIKEIRKYTNRHIIVRPHPRGYYPLENIENNVSVVYPECTGIYGDPILHTDLEKTIQSAWAVINYNSTPALKSIFMGVPIFTDKSSLCWEVSNPDLSTIETPIYPDREQWANDIVYTEWFENEIRSGIPWERLKKLI